MDSERTFILNTPISKADGEVIKEITLKEPTAGQIESAESSSKNGSGNTMNINLIGYCAELHPQVIRSLRAKDYTAMVKWIEGFLEPGPTTGANSLQT